jgi:hypothetical protein
MAGGMEFAYQCCMYYFALKDYSHLLTLFYSLRGRFGHCI